MLELKNKTKKYWKNPLIKRTNKMARNTPIKIDFLFFILSFNPTCTFFAEIGGNNWKFIVFNN